MNGNEKIDNIRVGHSKSSIMHYSGFFSSSICRKKDLLHNLVLNFYMVMTMGKKEIAHVPSSPLRWYELVWLSSSPTVWLYLICLAFVNLEVLYNISFQIDFLYKLYIGKQVQRWHNITKFKITFNYIYRITY